MAQRKKVVKKKAAASHSWSPVVFGAVLLVGLGLALITAYRAGASRQFSEDNKMLQMQER